MARPRSQGRSQLRIDEAALAAFRAGLRRRYTDEDILEELRQAAAGSAALRRCGSSRRTSRRRCTRRPSSSTSAPGTPRSAPPGLYPRRFLTRDELLEHLREPRRGARAYADRARPRGAPARPAVGLALRAHVRLARRTRCARRGSRSSGRGAAGAGDRAGRRAGTEARPAPEDGRLEGCAPRRQRAPLRVAGLPAARRAAGSVDRVPVPRRERLRDEGVEVRPDGSASLALR